MTAETKAAVFTRKLEDLTLVRVVRSGLVSMIPILTIGAFALILQTFPAAGYQRFLGAMEEAVWSRALDDRPQILIRFGPEVKLSVNVTGTTVVTPRFQQFCRQRNAKEPFRGRSICVEVTEQAALTFNEETLNALKALKEMGLLLAIDDFSMGQTSLHYLKDNMFDIIKLDGSLVRGLFTHQNNREIISSITQLANSLNLMVLSEFVETQEQRAILHEIGCDCYQGYLYSPAVSLT